MTPETDPASDGKPDSCPNSGPGSGQQDAFWMRAALEAARCALPLDVPVGAVLLAPSGEGACGDATGSGFIARAWNRREADRDPTAHAEIRLLQAASARLGRWRLTDTILYVTLEPCPMCAAAIQQARVSRVVFGADDPILGACGSRWDFLGDTPGVSLRRGVLEAECRALLQDFFRERR
jgi:tRNA(adenine34) deaminase